MNQTSGRPAAPVVEIRPREILDKDVPGSGRDVRGHAAPYTGAGDVPSGKPLSRGHLQDGQGTTTSEDVPSGFQILEPGRAYRYRPVEGPHYIELTLRGIRIRQDGRTGYLDVRRPIPNSKARDNLVVGNILFRLDHLRDRVAVAERLGSRKDGYPDDTHPPGWWAQTLETFLHFIRQAEQQTSGETWIAQLNPDRGRTRHIEVLGLPVLTGSRSTILFGAGGSGKSYLAAVVAGTLASAGYRVGWLDWEDDAEVLAERTQMLFGPNHGLDILHVPLSAPLTDTLDYVIELVNRERLSFLVIDSAAPAAGKPEASAETGGFFDALKQLKVPALVICHITKPPREAKQGHDVTTKYPFGSVMWHNRAGETWYVEATDDAELVLKHRKHNYTGKRPDIHIAREFTHDSVTFAVINEEHRAKSIRAQIEELIGRGIEPSTRTLAEKLPGVSQDTIKRTLSRIRSKSDPELPRAA